jgi:hypothetical protein
VAAVALRAQVAEEERAVAAVAAVGVAADVAEQGPSQPNPIPGATAMKNAHTVMQTLLRRAAVMLIAFATPAILLTSPICAEAATEAKAAGPATFATPEAAVDQLIAAVRANDRAALLKLFGSKYSRLIDSGDPVEDAAARKKFAEIYDSKHSIRVDGDKATLVIGGDDYPTPIPLVKTADGWHFDAAAGEEEILARRIGRNELNAMQVCLAFIDAERDYSSEDRDGDGIAEYAQRFISSPGKHDGLYWPTKEGEAPSPAGIGLADAAQQQAGKQGPTPYHGYYYRMLKAQGKNAPGGDLSYVANGKLIGGVGLVAYPARYLASGVMTFMCNQDGVVYQKNLGPNTAELAKKMTKYDPDSTWQKAN